LLQDLHRIPPAHPKKSSAVYSEKSGKTHSRYLQHAAES